MFAHIIIVRIIIRGVKVVVIIFGIAIIGVILFLCLWIYYAIIEQRDKVKYSNVRDRNIKEFENMVSKYNLCSDNIREHLRFDDKCGSIIYTNDNKLIAVLKDNSSSLKFKIKEIKLEDILDISIDVSISEKNRMRIISLTPTFDNYKSMYGLGFKVTTEFDTYNFTIEANSKIFFSDYIIFNSRSKYNYDLNRDLDKMKRIKMLLERQVEKVNKTN